MDDFLYQASIYLAAAVIAVPLSARSGAGVRVGVSGRRYRHRPGVRPCRCRNRKPAARGRVRCGHDAVPDRAGAGTPRVVGYAGQTSGPGWPAGRPVHGRHRRRRHVCNHPWSVALAVGLTLSLSSTAIVLQTLSEKGLMQTNGGRATFSVLLTQDIAVIPILALLPLLALPSIPHLKSDGSIDRGVKDLHDAGHHSLSLVEGLPGWAVTLVTIGGNRVCDPCGRLPDAALVPLYPRHPPARDVYGAGANDRSGNFLPDDACWPVPCPGCLSGGRCSGQLGIPA